MAFVFAGYAVVVVGLGVYLLWLAQRQRDVAAELASLEAEIATRQGAATTAEETPT